MMKSDLKVKQTTQLVVPFLVGLTLLYSLVYHILMFNAIAHEVSEDECAEQLHAGGIVPPQCLELEVFRDWHKKEAEYLLAPSPALQEQTELDSSDIGLESVSDHASKRAVVVDVFGQTSACAQTISEDLAGLEKKMNELVVSSKGDISHDSVDASKQDSDESKAALNPWGSNMEAIQEKVHQALHDGLDHMEEASQGSEGKQHGPESFGQFHKRMEERHKRREENRKALVAEISQRMDKLDKSLLDVVSDRKAWETTLLEKYHAPNKTETDTKAAAPSKQSSFMSKRLQWSGMPTVYHTKNKVSDFLEATKKEAVSVHKSDIRHLHWEGKLPKIAAIAWIKGDRKHRARMMYFVDNFKLQDYQGEKELMLVYHHKDEVAAHIVARYENDTEVKSVVAHDKSEDMFPSDPALRYAAWTSDADLIAQWDFEEFHDPSRLSLQVKSLAYTKRHASVLATSSTSHSQDEEAKEYHQVSILGEKSWMKANWHPFSERHSEIAQTFILGEIVELDLQNKDMMSNISRIEHVFSEAATPAPVAKESDEKQQGESEEGSTDFSRGISECLGYDHTKGHENEEVAEKAITDNVGEEFGKKFHNLVKRRKDVIMKLQLLCFQSTMEKDAGKRKFMHDHVLEMDHIRSELDKHIDNAVSLFGAHEIKG
jgi:hypothetical protein